MNNTIDIRYVLERYRSGGANRYVCPQCGRKKCFTRYVDLESGGYVADECGKCNHVVSCGYHYPPREFFHDHPWLNSREVNEVEFIQGKPLLGLSRRRTLMVQEHRQVIQERHQTVFLTWHGLRNRCGAQVPFAVGWSSCRRMVFSQVSLMARIFDECLPTIMWVARRWMWSRMVSITDQPSYFG